MSRKRKETLNDILSRARPYGGGEKLTFAKEFPQIAEVTIEWAQFHQFKDGGENKRVGPHNIPEALDCENYDCEQGGVPTRPLIRKVVSQGRSTDSITETCHGEKKMGRSRLPCTYMYHIRVTVRYKDELVQGVSD
jgi:hypothetical protein